MAPRSTQPTVAAILRQTLPQCMGPAFDDIEHISGDIGLRGSISISSDHHRFLSKRSNLQFASLNRRRHRPVQVLIDSDQTNCCANDNYYLGRPAIDKIVVTNVIPASVPPGPKCCAIDIDMLYEVGPDAL